MKKENFIPRDISWLSFNARVLQEAKDPTVPLPMRIKFLGIHSNNMDEFYRVRVAALKRIAALKPANRTGFTEGDPQEILDEIQKLAIEQQNEFNEVWNKIEKEMAYSGVFLADIHHLNQVQKQFVHKYFEDEVESNVIPLMISDLAKVPYLREKSIFLAVIMKNEAETEQKYALIEIPSRILGRFKEIPSKVKNEHVIILLEDVIRLSLPHIFSYFGYSKFESYIFKMTKDAEFELDNDLSTTIVQKIEKGIRNRRKGDPTRFVYDKNMPNNLLKFLINKLKIDKKDNIIPGGKIHNFRHFMDFPDVFSDNGTPRPKPFKHPAFANKLRVTDTILKKDVMLSFPYHSFVSVIDLLREAAMDPDVVSIKITAYRLASKSKIANALINAIRNGKDVTVMIELKARFDEENNLEWKQILEEEGAKVLIGVPNLKVHAKVCVIKKRVYNKTVQYGFVSTGNLNEKTARIYGDQMVMTSNRFVMADINRIFKFLERPNTNNLKYLRECKTLLVSPTSMYDAFIQLINNEIKAAKAGKKAEITMKVNSFSDLRLVSKVYEAAEAGVTFNMIVRGIFCLKIAGKKLERHIRAISIVDEYLEHARIFRFHNGGDELYYISSADWMVRNLEHRVEAAIPIKKEGIKAQLRKILDIQLADNVKARVLDKELSNTYVKPKEGQVIDRSQISTYIYLQEKSKDK